MHLPRHHTFLAYHFYKDRISMVEDITHVRTACDLQRSRSRIPKHTVCCSSGGLCCRKCTQSHSRRSRMSPCRLQ
uniref:Uncharacterized protein n=1 Tax=Anguilla anguilla TaxID=7936 RepID=A0A0E9TZC1_ANGAN